MTKTITVKPPTTRSTTPLTPPVTTQPTLPWGSNARIRAMELMTEARSLLRYDAPERLEAILNACQQNDLAGVEYHVNALHADVSDYMDHYREVTAEHGDLIAAYGGITELPNSPQRLSI